MTCNKFTDCQKRPYPVFNPIFEEFSNERLYAALCDATTSLDDGLKELHQRLKPIIMNASKGFLTALSWTMDNALGEALIFLWDLVRKHSYKGGRVPFHNFFGKCWQTRLNDLFAKLIIKTPVLLGDMQTGWSAHQPVFCCAYGFHEKAADYREKKYAQQKAWLNKKRAEQGLPPIQPRKPAMSDEERREKNRIRAAARFAALTPEQKRAQYDRDNERRRAKRAAETPEEKEERRARYAGYARARAERKKAQEAE